MIIELTFIFFFSFASLFMLRKIAKRIGLVDKPNLRKHHEGTVPLIGGIAVFVTLAQYIYTHPNIIPHSGLFLASIAILTVIGAFDDKYDVSFKFRLIVQTVLTIIMIYITGLELNTIGDILGLGPLSFGLLAPVITIFAVLGAINAFNMVDGIDGLLGGLSIVTFSGLAVILNLNDQPNLVLLCTVIIVAMIPYVLMNLGLLSKKRRVFMGDAGSMMIGFTIIWLLLSASQNSNTNIMRPVTGLWLIALPLMDMIVVMARRISQARSPFRPDRDHLHHLCLCLGFTNIHTLIMICSVATIFAGFGILGEIYQIPEATMFISFLVTFCVYALLLLKYWPQRINDMNNTSSTNLS